MQTKYGIVKAKPTLPAIDLLKVPHRNGILTVSHPAFGLNIYQTNTEAMKGKYFHSEELPEISFREPTTSESISVATYKFETMAKSQIFDPRWLQLGRIIRTSEGVYANPPKDGQGNSILDEKELKRLLERAKKEPNGIYLSTNPKLRDFGFAPYESFTLGLQDCDTFARGGLARLLEFTEAKIAPNLRGIASPKFYKKGVNVLGFEPVEEPIEKFADLSSDGDFSDRRLGVCGCWDDSDGDGGYAFGVLD